MNTSFASQLVGFILTNGTFEIDSEVPCFSAFVVKSEGVTMRMWQPRAGYLHLSVIVGDWDNGIHYDYATSQSTVAGRSDIAIHQSLNLATPDGYGDYELKHIQSDFYQKAG